MPNSKYNALIFDMDGLIFDSEAVYKQCWLAAARLQGLLLPDDLYQTFIGIPDRVCEQLLEQHFKQHPSYSFELTQFKYDRDRLHQAKRSAGIAFKPGFEALISQAVVKQYRLALVTSSLRRDVNENFANSKYLELFEVIITAQDVRNGKPNPEGYLKAVSALELASE
ncbi:HAD family hydrolase [Vibrio gallicus]|uniref:HAD family hydrolase n=1 Tax=Vibrio gallicus TaxID=190897 RepID=UPI0021C31488|nr:HAD family phosphatase [Vibrio gallicus]